MFVAHFSINADEPDRAMRFYEGVFGWKFQAYGPPGFFMIDMPPATLALRGSLQKRPDGRPAPLTGFECTIAVPDAAAAVAAVESHGGEIVMPLCTLAGIGHLFYFKDPEGNMVGAMQYDSNAL
jgi:uncharacterized protein